MIMYCIGKKHLLVKRYYALLYATTNLENLIILYKCLTIGKYRKHYPLALFIRDKVLIRSEDYLPIHIVKRLKERFIHKA